MRNQGLKDDALYVADAQETQCVNKSESTSLSARNRMRDRLLPVNSKRRIIYLIVLRTILDPRRAFANINRAHIRKLLLLF